MNTPLGTEVDLGPGHIVLDGVPAPRESCTAAPRLFSAHVYCGHGRSSQLLLCSCYTVLIVFLQPVILSDCSCVLLDVCLQFLM